MSSKPPEAIGRRRWPRRLAWTAIALLTIIAVAIAYAWTPDTDAAVMRVKYGGNASQFLEMGNGLVLHVRDEGPRGAPVVVLLHGSNASLHTWDGWTARLRDRYRIVRVDLPGHGLTGAYPARAYARDAYVAIVDRLVERLAIDRFVLGGNSMGGGVTWAYAHRHPGKLSGQILVDASGEPEPGDSQPPLVFRLARWPGVGTLMTRITPRSLIGDGLRGSVAQPERIGEATIDLYWELLRYPGNRQATIDRFAAPRDPPVVTPLPRAIPTLILWGAQDRLIPVSSAAWFAKRAPGARVIVYPDAGHLPMEELPDRSAADVARFMAALH